MYSCLYVCLHVELAKNSTAAVKLKIIRKQALCRTVAYGINGVQRTLRFYTFEELTKAFGITPKIFKHLPQVFQGLFKNSSKNVSVIGFLDLTHHVIKWRKNTKKTLTQEVTSAKFHVILLQAMNNEHI